MDLSTPSPDSASKPPRFGLDRYWLRSIGFTMFLVGLVAVATGADWSVTTASIAVSAIGFGFFYLVFPGGAHFGMTVANFLAIYACMFEFFRDSNFSLASRHVVLLSLSMPVMGFLITCFIRRDMLARLIRARRLREVEQLPGLMGWLFATMCVGALSFVVPRLHLDQFGEDIALLVAMALITLMVAAAVREVVLVMVDVSLVFESVAEQLDRLMMPVIAFLTVYGLLIVVFACLYRIADMTSATPQFTMHGEPYRVHFVDTLYFSVVTITTVGFGDLSPVSLLARALSGMEVVCGVLMLLFGFSEIMRNAGPGSRFHERPPPRNPGRRDSSA
ncbi:MAG: potassium channel family protein [Acetobacteraceae bacterium]